MTAQGPDRRTVAAGLLAAAVPLPAFAQSAGIEIVCAGEPGSGDDQVARALAEGFQRQRYVSGAYVSNVSGAGGTVGLANFINQPRRGGGLIIASLGLLSAVIVNKSPVTLKQTTPLARMLGEHMVLTVGMHSPFHTLDDLRAAYTQNPSSVAWGGRTTGGPTHLFSARIAKAMGGDPAALRFTAYPSSGQKLADLSSGKIAVAAGHLAEFAQQIRGGAVRALGLSASVRRENFDVPTFREQGVDVVFADWRGVMAPMGMDRTLSRQFGESVKKLLEAHGWKQLLLMREWTDLYLPGDAFGAFLVEEEAGVRATLSELGMG